jgi:hypothetical protein
MDFNTMHKQRKFVMIAALIGLIGCFLPWVTFPGIMGIGGGSWNGFHRGGLLVFVSMIAAGVMAFLGDQKNNLSQTAWLVVLGAGAISVLICILTMINKFGAGDMGGYVKVGFGLFIAAAGAVGVVAAAYLFKGSSQDLKQSLNEMKKTVENKLDGDPNT